MSSFTAKSLDEALELAAQELGCDKETITYTVVEEKKGVLGLGASVTIEADVPEVEEEIEEEAVIEPEEEEEETHSSRRNYSESDVKDFLFDYLGNFFEGIELDADAAIEVKDGQYIVNLGADNNAVLIGRQGKTLDAFNAVVRAAVNSHFHARIDVLIDVNYYKEDRYHKLASMARRTAKQVQRSHVDATLDPMPNDERKAIHRALNKWHNISTESEGQGADRHVVIKYVPDQNSEEPEDTADEAE